MKFSIKAKRYVLDLYHRAARYERIFMNEERRSQHAQLERDIRAYREADDRQKRFVYIIPFFRRGHNLKFIEWYWQPIIQFDILIH